MTKPRAKSGTKSKAKSTTTTASDWRADSSSQASAQQRALIVASARDCINVTGHEKLRMEAIAGQARCSRATVYRYFGGKKDILLAIALENFQQINKAVDELTLDVPDVRMQLAVGLAHTMVAPRGADATYQFTTQMLHQAMASDVSEFKDVIAQRIAPSYHAARELGWLRAGVSEDAAINWIMLASAGLMEMGWPRISGKDLGPEEQVEYVCRYLLYPIFQMDDVLPG